MQPYLFPYLGYFDLIHYADRWIVFDEAQFIRRGWVNRNRILHPQHGWQYIGVPVSRAPQQTPIREIVIHGEGDWKRRMCSQIEHYRKTAPNYRRVRDLLIRILEPDLSRIVDLNVRALSMVCAYIGLDFRYDLISNLPVIRSRINGPEDWALQLCELTGADEYANLPGGRGLYRYSEFENRGLKLTFRELPRMSYDCPGYDFMPDLSIIDVLMWNEPENVMEHLRLNENQDTTSRQEVGDE